jgi:predicted DNA binding CopG/RHH family protein
MTTMKKAPSLGRAGKGASKPMETVLREAKHSSIQGLEELGLSPASALAAEAELARQVALTDEERVNMRWGKLQLDMVREASLALGIPYQTYIKQVATRQAMADLAKAKLARMTRGVKTRAAIMSEGKDGEKVRIELFKPTRKSVKS